MMCYLLVESIKMIYCMELQDKNSKAYIEVEFDKLDKLMTLADSVEKTGCYLDKNVDLISVEIKKDCHV